MKIKLFNNSNPSKTPPLDRIILPQVSGKEDFEQIKIGTINIDIVPWMPPNQFQFECGSLSCRIDLENGEISIFNPIAILNRQPTPWPSGPDGIITSEEVKKALEEPNL